MKPAGAEAAARAVGLVSVSVAPGYRHRGLSTFLLVEAFRQLAGQGVREIEAQSREADATALALFKHSDFSRIAGAEFGRRTSDLLIVE